MLSPASTRTPPTLTPLRAARLPACLPACGGRWSSAARPSCGATSRWSGAPGRARPLRWRATASSHAAAARPSWRTSGRLGDWGDWEMSGLGDVRSVSRSVRSSFSLAEVGTRDFGEKRYGGRRGAGGRWAGAAAHGRPGSWDPMLWAVPTGLPSLTSSLGPHTGLGIVSWQECTKCAKCSLKLTQDNLCPTLHPLRRPGAAAARHRGRRCATTAPTRAGCRPGCGRWRARWWPSPLRRRSRRQCRAGRRTAQVSCAGSPARACLGPDGTRSPAPCLITWPRPLLWPSSSLLLPSTPSAPRQCVSVFQSRE